MYLRYEQGYGNVVRARRFDIGVQKRRETLPADPRNPTRPPAVNDPLSGGREVLTVLFEVGKTPLKPDPCAPPRDAAASPSSCARCSQSKTPARTSRNDSRSRLRLCSYVLCSSSADSVAARRDSWSVRVSRRSPVTRLARSGPNSIATFSIRESPYSVSKCGTAMTVSRYAVRTRFSDSPGDSALRRRPSPVAWGLLCHPRLTGGPDRHPTVTAGTVWTPGARPWRSLFPRQRRRVLALYMRG